jgi:hypothetical protein
MTVYLVISLPKMPVIHRMYMVLANPTHDQQNVRVLLWRLALPQQQTKAAETLNYYFPHH